MCLYLVFWFSKQFKLSIIGFFISAIIVSGWGYMHEHGARTGDHDALLVCFTILALLNIYQYFESSHSNALYKFFIFFTLAVLTKSIVVFLIVPGLIVFTIYRKQSITTLKDSRIWKGLSCSIVIIAGFYIARELSEPGYLKAVWHNELFPRYLNQSDRYQYNQTDFWYYYNELKNWQFAYWFPLIIPSFIVSISCYQKGLKTRHSRLWRLLMTLFRLLLGCGIHQPLSPGYLQTALPVVFDISYDQTYIYYLSLDPNPPNFL